MPRTPRLDFVEFPDEDGDESHQAFYVDGRLHQDEPNYHLEEYLARYGTAYDIEVWRAGDGWLGRWLDKNEQLPQTFIGLKDAGGLGDAE